MTVQTRLREGCVKEQILNATTFGLRLTIMHSCYLFARS